MDKYSAPSLFNDQQTQAQALMEFANAEGPELLSSMCWAELAKQYKEIKAGSLSAAIEKLFCTAFNGIFDVSIEVTTMPTTWSASNIKDKRAEAMQQEINKLFSDVPNSIFT